MKDGRTQHSERQYVSDQAKKSIVQAEGIREEKYRVEGKGKKKRKRKVGIDDCKLMLTRPEALINVMRSKISLGLGIC